VRYLVDEMRLDPERIRIVYNSIPIPEEEPMFGGTLSRSSIELDESDLVVGIVASLRKEKDHATLIRAISEMRQQSVNAVLVVVGDGPERPDLEDLATILGINAHVRFLGQRSDVLQLLPLFDVVALSSFTIECFPYAVLEAMAASRAVVATCVGGLPEMIEDGATGRLVPPRAPSAMAEALEDLLTHPEKAARFGEAGRKRLENRWPFGEIVSRVEQEILKALSSSTAELVEDS
jgi:glycosyltransferase involved in cell wall biosynthesis